MLGRGAEPFPSPPSQARSFARSSLVKLGRAQGRSVAKGFWQVARRCRAQSWARRCRAATVSDVYRHKSASVATRQRRVQPGTATPTPKAFPSQARSFPGSSLDKLDVPGGSLDPLTEKQAKPDRRRIPVLTSGTRYWARRCRAATGTDVYRPGCRTSCGTEGTEGAVRRRPR